MDFLEIMLWAENSLPQDFIMSVIFFWGGGFKGDI